MENAVSVNAAAIQIIPDTDDFENKTGIQLERINNYLEQFEIQNPALTEAFTAPTSISTNSHNTGHLKLPKLDLTKFNGQ